MKKRSKLDFSDLAGYRKLSRVNQLDFWSRFAVTQSGGSRYETGRRMPTPVAMLLWLVDSGRISDEDLEKARKAVAQLHRKEPRPS